MGCDKLLNFPFGYSGLFTQHDGNRDILPEGFVRHCENDGLSDCWMLQNHVIDFPWRDFLSAPVDVFFETPTDEKIPVCIEISLVTGPKPTPREAFCVGVRTVYVTCRNIGATNHDLANFASG